MQLKGSIAGILFIALSFFSMPMHPAYALDLKWAHVYETGEAFHQQALWAADEIRKRTGGEINISVFAAGQLGNENQINEGLSSGTIDIIYTGLAYAAAVHPPLAMSNAPFILRDLDHWKAYRDSSLFRQVAGGYEEKTGHRIMAMTYYGQRHLTANREIDRPEDMKGLKIRVPPVPLYLMFTRSVGAEARPIAFADVYNALKQGKVDGEENPLPTIKAKKFYEVQSHIMLTGHIIDSLLTVVGGHVLQGLDNGQRAIVDEVLKEAAARASEDIRDGEGKLIQEFRDYGLSVIEVDRKPFADAARPLLTDPEAGADWSRADYDALQAL